MGWDKITQDPRFSELTVAEQRYVADSYFEQNVMTHPKWNDLSGDERKETRKNFLATIGQQPRSTFAKNYLAAIEPIRAGVKQVKELIGVDLLNIAASFAPDNIPVFGREDFYQYADWMKDKINNSTIPIISSPLDPVTIANMKTVETAKDIVNPIAVYNTIASNGPTLGTLLLAYTANPYLGMGLTAAMEGSDVAQTYREYEDKTGEEIPEVVERGAPIIVGAANAAIERLSLDKFLEPVGRGLRTRLIKSLITAGWEGTTEAGQEVTKVLAEAGVAPSDQDSIIQRLRASFWGGAALGLIGGAIGGEREDNNVPIIYLDESDLMDTKSEVLGLPPHTELKLLRENNLVVRDGRTEEGVIITPSDWGDWNGETIILPEDLRGPYKYNVTPAIVNSYKRYANTLRGLESARKKGYNIENGTAATNQALSDLATRWIEANPDEEYLDGLSNMLALKGHTSYKAWLDAEGKEIKRPVKGETVFQAQEPGAEIPATPQQLTRLLGGLKKSGLFSTIIVSPTPLRKSLFNAQINMMDDAEVYAAVNPSTGVLHLSPRIRLDTIGHEAFEVLYAKLGSNDAVVRQGLNIFNGDKEALADAVGRYYEGTLDQSMLERISTWMRQLMAQAKNLFGASLTQTEIVSVLNGRIIDGVDSFAVGTGVLTGKTKDVFERENRARRFYATKIAAAQRKLSFGRESEKPYYAEKIKIYERALDDINNGVYQFQQEDKYAGSINVTHLGLTSTEKNLIHMAMLEHEKNKTSWSDVDKDAGKYLEDVNKMERLILKASKGSALTASELTAMRKVVAQATHGIIDMTLGEATNDDLVTALDSYSYILDAYDTSAHTAGAALASLRRDLDTMVAKAIKDVGRELRPDELQRLQSINKGDPIQVKQFLSSLSTPKFMEYIYDVYYNSILSGVTTHLKNIASNTLWFAYQFPHRAITSVFDSAISQYTGKDRSVFINEVMPMLSSIPESTKLGARYAKEIITTGRSSYSPVTKIDQELNIGAFERSPYSWARSMAPYINMPTRALRAMDVFANVIAYNAEIQAQAYKKAKSLGGNVNDKMRELIQSPTRDMRKKAETFARYATFTDHAGRITQQITRARNTIPGGKFVMPFIRTLSNIMTRGLEMTPGVGLGLEAMNRYRGWGKQSLAEIAAKQFEGAVLAYFLLSMTDDDRLVGNVPSDPSQRDAFYRQGKIPWSIKIGDRYYSYSGVEPFNTVMSMVAVGAKVIQDAPDDQSAVTTFMQVTQRLVNTIIDSSYLDSVMSLTEDRGITKRIVRLPSTLVPYGGLFRTLNTSIEIMSEGSASVRSYGTVTSELARTVPWPLTALTEKAPARLNAWGKDISVPGGILRQWLPIKWGDGSMDKVELELQRLDIYPGTPNRFLTVGGREYKLSEKFYRDYCIVYGMESKKALDSLIKQQGYQRLSDEMKERTIDRTLRKTRARVTQEARRMWVQQTRAQSPFRR